MNQSIDHRKAWRPKPSLLVGALIISLLAFGPRCAGAPASGALTLLSPDGRIRLDFFLSDQARLRWRVSFKDQLIIEPSSIVISLDQAELSQGVEISAPQRSELNERYPWRGVHSEAINHYHGLLIPVRHSATKTAYTLEARAFNDGIAFRHVLPGGDKPRVPDESTTFLLPAGSAVWSHDLNGHYEGVHDQKAIDEIRPGQWAAPPVTYKLPGGAGYASIMEAALVNYSGMALQADGRRGFTVVLGHNHPVSYPFRLRYSNDLERVSRPATLSGTITSPWRVLMIGADLNALVNSDLVQNLCPAPDPKLFPQGLKTAWLKPGRAVWRYLDGGRNTFEEMKEFSRWAGELGFEYHVIEGFWSRWTDEQIKELVNYSRQHGVGLWFWKHSRQLRTAEERQAFFRKLHDFGVVGAKIDFFDHEQREIVDLYPTLLKEAAQYQILVNFHGASKPSGEPRTWPNELIREGVRGMEASRLQTRARHNTTLPFTRYLAGHGDYTPVHFGARRGDTTWTHQIATAAVFNEPLLTYAAHPTNLLQNPALEMIQSIPAVWDETVVLPCSEIGELAAFARRAGDRWFLAILNGPTARTIRVPLSFLARGQYRALLLRDQKEDPAAIRIEQIGVSREDAFSIELNNGGGFIARFSLSPVASPARTNSSARGVSPGSLRVFLLDPKHLQATRARIREGDTSFDSPLAQLLRQAHRALSAGPFSVVHKDATPPSGDKHDYMSQAPYFWPNPDTSNGLPYLRRDGERNPEIDRLPDHRHLDEMVEAVENLALAYYFKGDETHAAHAARLLRAWFLDETTRMNPHLQYGQAIPGVSTGRGIGLIETRGLTSLVDAIGLLAESKAWSQPDQLGLEQWFERFLQWMVESAHGRAEAAAANNHGTYYDLQVVSFALFLGRDQLAADLLQAARQKRIARQIEPDGRQPLELARTKAWSYSVGNLQGLMSLARLGENVGVDLWNYQAEDGRSLRKALDFLVPFAAGDQPWPYQQLGGFSSRALIPAVRRAALHYPEERYRALLAKFPEADRPSWRALVQPNPPERPEESATSSD